MEIEKEKIIVSSKSNGKIIRIEYLGIPGIFMPRSKGFVFGVVTGGSLYDGIDFYNLSKIDLIKRLLIYLKEEYNS